MADRLLDRIDAPSDLRGLSHDELTQVAQEVRDTIISVITERGGHLASNLGVVELTLALHRIFRQPPRQHSLGHHQPDLHAQAGDGAARRVSRTSA